MKEIIKKAEEFSLSETRKHGTPPKRFLNTSNKKGQELAKELNVNVNIVRIGTRLMDIKLGGALNKDKPGKHVEMSVEATKNFLEKIDLDKETKEKIINCVAAHHSPEKWNCKEAEICANADCYRFLSADNWLFYLHTLGSREGTFEEDLNFARKKAVEKWNILSLDKCKKELKKDYKLISEIVNRAKK